MQVKYFLYSVFTAFAFFCKQISFFWHFTSDENSSFCKCLLSINSDLVKNYVGLCILLKPLHMSLCHIQYHMFIMGENALFSKKHDSILRPPLMSKDEFSHKKHLAECKTLITAVLQEKYVPD